MLSWTRKCREPSLLDHPQSQGSLFLIKPRFFLVHSRKITPPYRQLETMHRGGFSLFDYLCQRSSWVAGAGGTKGTIVFLPPRFWINAPTFSDLPKALFSIFRPFQFLHSQIPMYLYFWFTASSLNLVWSFFFSLQLPSDVEHLTANGEAHTVNIYR